MPQIFHPSANTLSRDWLFFGLAVGPAGSAGAGLPVDPVALPDAGAGHPRSSRCSSATSTTSSGLGIDCRYCHTSVETAAFAGHAADRDLHDLPLADLDRQPDARAGPGQPAENDADRAGTGSTTCPTSSTSTTASTSRRGSAASTCHGRVDQMPLTWKEEPMTMEWCLDCHRHPERYIRPEASRSSTWTGQPPNGPASPGASSIQKIPASHGPSS